MARLSSVNTRAITRGLTRDDRGPDWLHRAPIDENPLTSPEALAEPQRASDIAIPDESVYEIPESPTPRRQRIVQTADDAETQRANIRLESASNDADAKAIVLRNRQIATEEEKPSNDDSQLTHDAEGESVPEETLPTIPSSPDDSVLDSDPTRVPRSILDFKIQTDKRVVLRVEWKDKHHNQPSETWETEWNIQELHPTKLYAFWDKRGGRDRATGLEVWHVFKLLDKKRRNNGTTADDPVGWISPT